jgi:hypothetical protein
MRTTIVLWCLIIFGAASAHAEPVYLNCHVSDSQGNTTRINITLDEANQNVSYLIVNAGFTQKTTGVFSTDTVFSLAIQEPQQKSNTRLIELIYRFNEH